MTTSNCPLTYTMNNTNTLSIYALANYYGYLTERRTKILIISQSDCWIIVSFQLDMLSGHKCINVPMDIGYKMWSPCRADPFSVISGQRFAKSPLREKKHMTFFALWTCYDHCRSWLAITMAIHYPHWQLSISQISWSLLSYCLTLIFIITEYAQVNQMITVSCTFTHHANIFLLSTSS